MARFRQLLGLLIIAVLSTACATMAPTGKADGWIESWGVAVAPPTPAVGPFPATPSFSDRTIRQVVRLSAGGEQLRVRLTNEYGSAPLQVGAARIALVDAAGALVSGSERTLTFSGSPAARIPAGAPLVSDPVDLAVDDLATLSISLYLPGDTGPCTCHAVGLQTGFVSPPGDHTAGVFVPAETVQLRAFIAGVEVMPSGGGETIVAFGDSITDGLGSTPDANRRWPDFLAERLAARDGGRSYGVTNVGISGNRLLSGGAGDAALARFDRDVLGRSGVSTVIVFLGVNDLGVGYGDFTFPPPPQDPNAPSLTAAAMIAGYEQLITRAHAHGISIIGATIAPYEGAAYYSESGETIRQEINAWIRDSGAFDAVLDFDAVLRDPAHPSRMTDGLHSGDFLHGSDAGYRAMAEAIDLSPFE